MSTPLSHRQLIFRLLRRRHIQSKFHPVTCTFHSDARYEEAPAALYFQNYRRNYTPEAYRPRHAKRRIKRDSKSEKDDGNESLYLKLKEAQELIGLHNLLLRLTNRYYQCITSQQQQDDDDDQDNDVVTIPFVDQHKGSGDPDNELIYKNSQQLLENLNKMIKLINSSKGHAIEAVIESEQAHGELCRLLKGFIRKLSSYAASIESYNERSIELDDVVDDEEDEEMEESQELHIAAEDLFFILCSLHSSRVQYAAKAEQDAVETVEKSQQGWMDWLHDIFVQAPGEEENAKATKETKRSFAHENLLYQPSSNLCWHVAAQSVMAEGMDTVAFKGNEGTPLEADATDIDSLYWKARIYPKAHVKERERRQEVARRLTRLFNKLARSTDPDRKFYSFLGWIIRLHGNVGLYSSATQGEKWCQTYAKWQSPSFLFHSVLRGYRFASFTDPSNAEKAAHRAFQLLKKRQVQTNKNPQKQREPKWDRAITASYKIVLQALINAEDGVEKAEELMELFLGKATYQTFIKKEKDDALMLPAHTDLGLLHNMFVLYCSSPTHFDRARRLMHHMEHQTKSNPAETNGNGETFPNSWTYHAFLRGLRNDSHDIRHSKKMTKARREKIRFENATLGQEILDSAVDLNFSPPFRSYLLGMLLWSKVSSDQAGDRAEELLSRMELVRRGNSMHAYELTLRCWLNAAVAGYQGEPSAARRARQLVDKMYAQSCANILTAAGESNESNNTDGLSFEGVACDKNLWMYRKDLKPHQHYNTVVKICSLPTQKSRRNEAIQIAFDTYNTMIERGVKPGEVCYRTLISCCHHFFPDDPETGEALAQRVFQNASEQGMDTDRLIKFHRGTLNRLKNQSTKSKKMPDKKKSRKKKKGRVRKKGSTAQLDGSSTEPDTLDQELNQGGDQGAVVTSKDFVDVVKTEIASSSESK